MEVQVTFLPKKNVQKEHYSLSSSWIPFDEGREFVRKLNLRTQTEWKAFNYKIELLM